MIEVLEFDPAELNERLVEHNFAALNEYLITYGGDFFSQTNNNFRYSYFGAGGKVSSRTKDDQTATLSLGHGGVWLEQMFPCTQFFAVSAGATASLGRLTLNLVHQTADDFTDGIAYPQQTVMKSTLFMLKPQIGVYYSVKRYLDLELKLGYHYSHTLGSWYQGGVKIPGDQILTELHGLTLMLNVNFGF